MPESWMHSPSSSHESTADDRTTNDHEKPILTAKIVDPGSANAGESIDLKIAVFRENVAATDFAGEVQIIATGSLSGGGVVQILDGIGSAKLVGETAELVKISLSDPFPPDLAVGEPIEVELLPGPASALILDPIPTALAGVAQEIGISAVDQFGNIDKSFFGTATLAATGATQIASQVELREGRGKSAALGPQPGQTIVSIVSASRRDLVISSTQSYWIKEGRQKKLVSPPPKPTPGDARP
jgi:hypothetical protein